MTRCSAPAGTARRSLVQREASLCARRPRGAARRPEPALRPGHVLVQTAFSAISSGTEGYIVRGTGDPTFVNHEYPDPNDPGVQYRDPAVQYTGPAAADPERRRVRLDRLQQRRPRDRGLAGGHGPQARRSRRLLAAASAPSTREIVSVPRNLIAKVPDNVGLDQAAFVTLGADLDGGAPADRRPTSARSSSCTAWACSGCWHADGASTPASA